MKTSDFSFSLPQELIAQTPLEPRDSSRLLVVPRDGGPLEHRVFRDLPEYIRAGDVVVVNDSRVLPARLLGTSSRCGHSASASLAATSTGATRREPPDIVPTQAHGGIPARAPGEGANSEAVVEILLLRERGLDTWECLVRPGRKFKPGARFEFGGGLLRAEVLEVLDGGGRLLKLSSELAVREAIHGLGRMPLPPYIHEQLADSERYQTIYSRAEGSAAAPTAGLHFTEGLLAGIRHAGAVIAPVTLHVGLGTFLPVKVEDVAQHHMHSEWYSISQDTAQAINQASRVWCIGTTALRAIESAAKENGEVVAGSGETSIFIYPGYRFRAAQVLVTNFHLPASTLLMLVSAFSGKERILAAYDVAVEERYRFFSFGDAMLLL